MDKIKRVIDKISHPDSSLVNKAQLRLDNLTKPKDSLGRLEELAKKIVGIQRTLSPRLNNKVIITMAADHGVAEEGVSAYPQEVTLQMVYNFIQGGAAINVLANHIGSKVIVVDMGVKGDLTLQETPYFKVKKIAHGTKNFTKGAAMTRADAIRAIEAGIDVVSEIEKIDIIGVGDMGIGNTTSSSAIVACFSGKEVSEVTGRGTGVDDATLAHKIRVIEEGLKLNQPNPADPLDVLAKMGGFEIGGLTGCILQAASMHIPVVIDGFISTASALIATRLAPICREYLIASHLSQEVGHKVMLEMMGLSPLFDLNLRLGEGTGAVLAMNVIEASVKILTEMATFDDAGVSRKCSSL